MRTMITATYPLISKLDERAAAIIVRICVVNFFQTLTDIKERRRYNGKIPKKLFFDGGSRVYEYVYNTMKLAPMHKTMYPNWHVQQPVEVLETCVSGEIRKRMLNKNPNQFYKLSAVRDDYKYYQY